MTTSELIINYANLHNGSFLRKDLMQELAGGEDGISEQTLSLLLNRLVSSCQLERKRSVFFANLQSVRLPGTEHMDKAYHQKKYHVIRSLWGMLIGLIPCLVASWLYTS